MDAAALAGAFCPLGDERWSLVAEWRSHRLLRSFAPKFVGSSSFSRMSLTSRALDVAGDPPGRMPFTAL